MNTTINTNKKPTEESEKKKEAAKWTLEQEELLAEWAEKAACYRWLHNKSEKQYRCRNYAFTIPVIILSTLTGTANFAMDSFVPEERKKKWRWVLLVVLISLLVFFLHCKTF